MTKAVCNVVICKSTTSKGMLGHVNTYGWKSNRQYTHRMDPHVRAGFIATVRHLHSKQTWGQFKAHVCKIPRRKKKYMGTT